ncbi:NADP-dependent oxidoreductase [bacterium]|nr:NADP-dependent oxidoreductase [bacterium]MDB4608806.1 NADP-dependent oxidoreductase [Flavobacteriaceae bacterium]MDB4714607.1 NADP-dependent oxidoreductase [Flavobacteriaceae bacterium]
MINKRQLLAERPKGMPSESTWNFVEEAVPELQEGEILVEQSHISLDPAMRGWMNETRSYIPPVGIGEVMRAGSVGKVIDAKGSAKFKVGDYVTGWGGVQQYYVGDGSGFVQIEPNPDHHTKYLGVLGMPGMTAYFGILEVGEIKAGDVVLVSGGAGAVGSVVGQIAKIKGCTVIGIAGGPEKCAYMTEELGFDGAIDYKNESVLSGIKRNCPKGIDVYFDNVGGDILDAALIFIRKNARIVICGAISQYNNTTAMQGPKNYLSLLVNRASMKGMVVLDYAPKYREAMQIMAGWMQEGKLKSKEDVYEGIENFRDTFYRLFNGDKLGKLVLKIKPE